jgi:hypothetical protein
MAIAKKNPVKFCPIRGIITVLMAVISSGVCSAKNEVKNSWIALLRDDFVVIPIAQLQPAGLTPVWTTPSDIDSNGLSNLPIPPAFFFSDSSNRKMNLLTKGKVLVEMRCQANWALLTNLSPQKDYYPNSGKAPQCIGIATGAKMPVFRERPLPAASPKFKLLARRITAFFDSLEAIKVGALAARDGEHKGEVAGWGIPVGLTDRKKIPVRMEISSVLSSQPPVTAYRFHLRKEYQSIVTSRGASVRCSNFSSFSGWLIPKAGGRDMILSTEFMIDYCDSREGSTLYPIGCFSHNGGIIWIGRRAYSQRDIYEVYRIKAGSIERVLEINGGGC